jgi:hypothetical protein
LIRIGCGTGYLDDRLDSAQAMAAEGAVDFLVFEGLAEATLAGMYARRDDGGATTFGASLIPGLRSAVAASPEGARLRIVTSLGGINVRAAAEAVADALDLLGRDLKIAAVSGDDVSDLVLERLRERQHVDFAHIVDGAQFPADADDVVGANVYLGAEPIADALDAGADVVVCGRVTDTAMYLGPLMHSYPHWRTDDRLLATGVVIGHLLECAGHICGGNYFGPEWRTVDFERIGHGLAEVSPNGDVVITKLASQGGMVTRRTCAEQLLYEIQDPANFMSPDVVVDLTGVELTELARDRVHLEHVAGRPAPDHLKLLIAYRDGYMVEGQASYGAPDARDKAQRAGEVLINRVTNHHEIVPLRWEASIVGLNSLYPARRNEIELPEARLRLVVHVRTAEEARTVSREMGSLYDCGPPGASGIAGPTAGSGELMRELIRVWPTTIPRDAVRPSVSFVGDPELASHSA